MSQNYTNGNKATNYTNGNKSSNHTNGSSTATNGSSTSTNGRRGKKKPLLVFVNPTSGTKLAKTMLKTILKPKLDEKDVDFELVNSHLF